MKWQRAERETSRILAIGGLSRNGVTNYSNGPCVTFLE